MKASKGSVVVESFKDRLRLRWRVAGRRYCLSLGLPDTQESRMLAELKARQIELDTISGNFDASLTKYKPQSLTENRSVNDAQLLTCAELFQHFMEYKALSLHPRSLDRYKTTLKYLHQFYYREDETRKLLAEQDAIAIVQSHAAQFNTWLQSKNAERARKERLILLNACWNWGRTKGFVETNPWFDLQQQVESVPIPPKPFTQQEVKAILAAFKTHPQYKHYADFVEFLFFTGVRTTEAIALRWQHINTAMSSFWVGESISRGVLQLIPANKARYIPLNDKIKLLLQTRKPENYLPDDLIFPSPEGLPIDNRNFRNRAWVKILELAGVEYRKPSNTRHTFICTCLSAGVNPAIVAQITGCNLQSLARDYAEYIPSVPTLPDLF